MDGSGRDSIKQGDPNSESQNFHDLTHMWISAYSVCIYKYICNIFVCVMNNILLQHIIIHNIIIYINIVCMVAVNMDKVLKLGSRPRNGRNVW